MKNQTNFQENSQNQSELILMTELVGQQIAEPNEEELRFYGNIIGLDIENEDQDLKWIATQALKAALPQNWKAYKTLDGQIVYVNDITNEQTLQHPLDLYFSTLAYREKLLKKCQNICQSDQQAVLSEECFAKANNTMIELNSIKLKEIQQVQQKILLEQEKLKDLQQSKILQQKHLLSQKELEQENKIVTEYRKQSKEMIQHDQLKIQYLQESVREKYDQKIKNKKLKLMEATTNQQFNNSDIQEQLQTTKMNEEKRLKERKQIIESECQLEIRQIQESLQNQKNKQIHKIKTLQEEKIQKIKNQIMERQIQFDQIKSQKKQQIQKQFSLQFSNQKQQIDKQFEQQMQELKHTFDQQLQKQKRELEMKYQSKLVNETTYTNQMQSFEQIEQYKNYKHKQFEEMKEQIKQEYDYQLDKDMQSDLYNKELDQDLIQQQIQDLNEQNENLRFEYNQLRKQKQSKSNNQFVTIGDIEHVQNQQFQHQESQPKRNLTHEFNKLKQFSRPPLSKSPTPSKESIFSQAILRSDQRSHTPTSQVSDKIDQYSEYSEQYQIIDRYKLKEIKIFVTNQLYKTQNKSQQLYSDFQKTQRLKQDMNFINEKTQFSIPDNMTSIKKIKQIEQETDLQFNMIRTQLRTCQQKHDILKRLKFSLKKHQETPLPQQKQQIEVEILNDYNYLRQKTSKDNERSKSQLSDTLSGYSTPSNNLSDITGMSDYDKFYEKWNKIIKSGMENDYTSLNPYATKILPQNDLKLETVQRLQKEISELRKMPKALGTFEYRLQLMKQSYNKNKDHVSKVLEDQQKWLSDLKMQLVKPLNQIYY